ncbi:MAG: DUF2806 domain-containing protein [Lachnospiraceae bacterium]|nr:DUF2806 domain-containing protein [Lachnospiraceae bacterium]
MGIIKKAGEAALDLAKNEAALDKTSNIMGMLFPYAGLTKKALDMYISDVENSDLPSESKLIAVLNAKNTIKKLKNQKNIAEIAVDTAKENTDFTEKSGVNSEWLERFMESAGFVSDEEVQEVWGKILGKEFENPGSTPSNMIRILSEITPTYARAFRKICSMNMRIVELDKNGEIIDIRRGVVVPLYNNEEKFKDLGLGLSVFNELEMLGLVKYETIRGYASDGVAGVIVLLCVNGETVEIELYKEDEIPCGNVMLTGAGICLASITPMETIEEYPELVKKYMESKQVKIKEHTEYQIIVEENGIRCEKIDKCKN